LYQVIYADPPWWYSPRKCGNERTYLPTKFGGGAEKHYRLMRDAELLQLRPLIDECAAPNSALFLWATCPRLNFAIDLVAAWGFRYCTVAFVWIKRSRTGGLMYGPGYYTASNAELVLLGIRGTMRPDRPMLQQVVEAPRGPHSRKPERVAALIEEMYPDASRIEMFARPLSPLFPHRPGWDFWGNEIEDGSLAAAGD
jgi:N6-adenosine-specific RNA methylase IME4